MASLAGAVLIGILPSFQPTAPGHAHVRANLAAGGGWLDRFNAWRASAGVPTLTENALWSDGDYKHSLYMVKNNEVAHQEISTHPYYTAEGDTAARNSNIYVSSSTSTTDETAIDWWMQAPFHAMGMMDPRLTTTGFGSYREVKSGWQMGASVDVLRGNPFSGGRYPVYFPGNGSTEPLRTFGGNETPDPLQACPGYVAPTGLPVFVEVGGNVATTAGPVHSIVGNGTALEHCIIDSNNAAVGSSLRSRGGVILIPRQPLQTGVRYVVTLTVNLVPYTWSFTVGPLNSTPPPPPVIPGWQSLGLLSGSLLGSGAAAVSCSAGSLDAFTLTSGGVPWRKTFSASAWNAWSLVGGHVMGDPGAACQPGTNAVDLYTEGVDFALYHRYWNGTAWGAWEKLGGSLTSGPGATSCAAGKSDVFVLGGDGVVWRKSFNGTSWSGWILVGGNVMGDPAVVCEPGTTAIDLFVRGTNNALYHRYWDGTAWRAWENLGGSLSSGPAASSCAAGKVDVFVNGGDGILWRKSFNGTTWSGWTQIGGNWTSDPAAVCQPTTTKIDLFARGPDYTLWWKELPS